MNTNRVDAQYGVLNPWADADPVPLQGLAPRVKDLAGKKIGLFHNVKPASPLILAAIEEELKARFPTCETILYSNLQHPGEGSDFSGNLRGKFEEWVKKIDVAVCAVGD
jgi:hypothetical protein